MAFALASGGASAATDLAGSWQGNWQNGASAIPRVVKIEKAPGGFYRAQVFNLGESEGHGPLIADAISNFRPEGDHVIFHMDGNAGLFDGTISKNGKSLTGTWQESNGKPAPMNLTRAGKADAWVIDPSPHTVCMVPVDKDVSLEVLDWGGSGPPLVLLAGLDDTAHNFDKFALNFTARHHVYGITRRGFGGSSRSAPTDANYDSDRLGDDVLAVIDALKLDRPVIAGHSFAGAEMSSIATRHPEKVAALIYLDAAFDYAFYEPKVPQGFPYVTVSTVHRDLERLETAGPAETRALTDEVLALLPTLQDGLQSHAQQSKTQSERPAQTPTPDDLVDRAVLLNLRKYTAIKPPFMVIAAVPHVCAPNCDSANAKHDLEWTTDTANAIAAEYPSARIVRLPYARHQVWNSNEADVVREMNAFLDGVR